MEGWYDRSVSKAVITRGETWALVANSGWVSPWASRMARTQLTSIGRHLHTRAVCHNRRGMSPPSWWGVLPSVAQCCHTKAQHLGRSGVCTGAFYEREVLMVMNGVRPPRHTRRTRPPLPCPPLAAFLRDEIPARG